MSEEELPASWAYDQVESLLLPQGDGRCLHQGWSPQCESSPAGTEEWGVLKTTAIQMGHFDGAYNKRLPTSLTPRPEIEVVPGDLLITCAGPRSRCGAATLVHSTRKHLMISGKMYRLRPDPVVVNPKYLELYLRSPVGQRLIDERKTGISDSGLNLTQARFLSIPIPVAPRQEQERIVCELERRLSHVDAASRSLESAQRRVRSARAATVAAISSGRLSVRPQRRLLEIGSTQEEEPAPRPGKWRQAAPVPIIETVPLHWEKRTLADLAWDAGYGTSVKCAAAPTDCPVLRIPNLTESGVSLDDLKYAPSGSLDQGVRLDRKDLLFVRTNGSRDVIGRSALAGIGSGMFFASYLIRFRLRGTHELATWIHLVVSSPQARSHLLARASSSAGQLNLGLSDIAGILIPIPPALEMAALLDEFERRFSLLEAAERSVSTGLLKVAQTRRALLAAAFSGRLVPQDASEEPATVLLERIKASQSAEDGSVRSRETARKEKVS